MNQSSEDCQVLAGKRVLVTGYSGFLGTHLLRHLHALRVQRVIGIARSERIKGGISVDLPLRVDLGDSECRESLVSILREEQPEYIFHLAGGPEDSLSGVVEKNVLAAAQLLDSVAKSSPDAKVVVLGSAAEYGRPPGGCLQVDESHPCVPESAYGAAKYAQTLLVREAARRGTKVNIARLFNVVGSGISPALLPGAVVARAIKATAAGSGSIQVGNVESVRDYISAYDAVRAIVKVAIWEGKGEVFNICSGSPTKIGSLIMQILARFPSRLAYTSDSKISKQSDLSYVVGSPEKLAIATGFRPSFDLGRSVDEMVQTAIAGGGSA